MEAGGLARVNEGTTRNAVPGLWWMETEVMGYAGFGFKMNDFLFVSYAVPATAFDAGKRTDFLM